MIEISNVTFTYPNSTKPVLQDVSLRIGEEAELVLVAGRTGCGKSTLLSMMNSLVPSFTGGELCGDVLLDGVSIKGTPPRELAHRIGFVAQDPAFGFVTDTVEEELAYGMEQLGLDAQTMRRRVEEALDLLGIADLRSRPLQTLSGGQQQRVAIGSVLTMHPQILILDEPTSALDPTAAEEVLALLSRLVHDLGLTVVLAEHRMERVVPFADRIATIEQGRVRVGKPEEILQDSPVAPPVIELGRLLAWNPLPLSIRDAKKKIAGIDLPKIRRVVVARGECVLEASALTVSYGNLDAVKNVNLDLSSGETTVLLGRNGSGKSSLLWALKGKKQSGIVHLAGGKNKNDDFRSVALVPQTAADLLYLETVAEECALADEQAGVTPGTTRKLLDRFVPGIADTTHPRDLSEGQRLALVLALILAGSPQVLALDEPTRGLDYDGKKQLAKVIKDQAAGGVAVIVATNDIEFAALIADRMIVLAEGEVVSEGDAFEVLAQSPALAPQVSKILGPDWLTVEQVSAALV